MFFKTVNAKLRRQFNTFLLFSFVPKCSRLNKAYEKPKVNLLKNKMFEIEEYT